MFPTDPGFGAWWVQWGNSPEQAFDASGFTHLTFWVRGARDGETFEIGLRDAVNQQEVKLRSDNVGVVEPTWTRMVVPLRMFAGVRPDAV
jgi:hypothetical protein